MNQPLIDIGINLMHRQFEEDREQVVKNAKEQNITPLIITATNIQESRKAAAYAERYPRLLFSTAGIHPHDAKTCKESTIEELKKLAKKTCVLAIGECGLDYDRDFSPRQIQRKWFEEQIQLAKEINLPLFLHERAAFQDFRKILLDQGINGERCVVHCFTGTQKELTAYLNMGCYIGITGWICDERRGKHLKEIVKQIPLNRLMIETDAPFLLPRDLKEKPENRRNEPKFLWHIAAEIAKCIGISLEQLAEITFENTKRFFQIP